ncbi:MAG: signal recognition particle protein [Anaerovoracaceae bacterium]|nr:signal recognition particle protein [Bacillota bacterium]MDY2670879.1 signal recognition particle protein [Anaerovoracaceae bacterium]
MAFEGLSEKLQDLFKNLRSKGTLTEADVNTAMREVKLALLEADVNFKVVKKFVANVKEKCLGEEVLSSLTPGQQVIKIVNEELTQLMGGTVSKLTYSDSGFTVYLLAGLQGTGKTTTAGKLANYLKKEGKKPMLAACDVHRPAAIDQLEIVGKQVDVPVYTEREEKRAEVVAANAKKKAEHDGYNVLIVDTSGRLHVDEELMAELVRVRDAVQPHETLLVIDALTGQDAVTAASAFNDAVNVDGIILTKLDGDTRGGAALSVREVTGKPIKFVGVGEKFDALQPFYPDRMASRILGMGDMLTLIEKAQEQYDEKEAVELEKKIRKNEFTLEDFLEQMGQIKKMGGMRKIIDMLPGVNGQKVSEEDIDKSEKEFVKMEAIIRSMTPAERADPKILNASRRKRIARGSGQPVSQINQLVKRYDEARKVMKQYTKPKRKGRKMRGGF